MHVDNVSTQYTILNIDIQFQTILLVKCLGATDRLVGSTLWERSTITGSILHRVSTVRVGSVNLSGCLTGNSHDRTTNRGAESLLDGLARSTFKIR